VVAEAGAEEVAEEVAEGVVAAGAASEPVVLQEKQGAEFFMNLIPFSERLAVCSWSLQPGSPEELVAKLKQIGVPRVQLALDPVREQPQVWGRVEHTLRAAGFDIVSGMIGFVGEDYTTMETIHATGGVAPDETWAENWENAPKAAEIAARLGLPLVTFHAGFLPPDSHDPVYAKMRHRLELIADVFAARNIEVAFETGQETAPVLVEFLRNLGRKNVGVNFDPANIILYDNGNPIEALRELGPWLKQIHIKDGTRTRVPGQWGEEVVAGKGEVPWPAFFATLRELNFEGWCCIEREAGTTRVEDIRAAREMVERVA
jgi:L-ribulose-5-phosphate 3-epimerase